MAELNHQLQASLGEVAKDGWTRALAAYGTGTKNVGQRGRDGGKRSAECARRRERLIEQHRRDVLQAEIDLAYESGKLEMGK